MSKLYIMKGLPASGKSTKAKEIVEASGGNTVRLNKDLLREMLHYYRPDLTDKPFNRKNEEQIREAQRMLARTFLEKNVNVIIDDTNLNPKTLRGWIDLAEEYSAKHEIVDMKTDVITCVLNDDERRDRGERYVGSTVIKNMSIQWGITKFSPNSVIICDIDGTIADIEHRRKHLLGEKKDWRSFFQDMHLDNVNAPVAKEIIEQYNKGRTIIYVSGRPDTYKEETLAWLHKNNLSFAYTLIMRGANDTREDSIIKEEILNTYFPDKQVISKVYDDRPRVIRMWKKNGLDVVDCGDGTEF